MALVTVTGNAWGHDRQPISSSLQPELWFRPLQSSMSSGLMSRREVKATLTVASGAFTVQLESSPGLLYVPVLRWLADASQANESIENRARQYDEWEPIFPAKGGAIEDLPGAVRLNGVYYGLGDPPSFLKERDDVIYGDISGTDVVWWGPAGAALDEGVVL